MKIALRFVDVVVAEESVQGTGPHNPCFDVELGENESIVQITERAETTSFNALTRYARIWIQRSGDDPYGYARVYLDAQPSLSSFGSDLVREAFAMVDSDNAQMCGGCFTVAFLEALDRFRS